MTPPRYCEECDYFGWYTYLECCDIWVCDPSDDRNGDPCRATNGHAPNTGCTTWTDKDGNVHKCHQF